MKIHVVQKGDTMWKIAKKYGVDYKELLRLNSQLSTPDVIYPGARIKIPTKRVPIRPRDSESPAEGQSPSVKEMPVPESRETPVVPPEIELRPMEREEMEREEDEGEIQMESPDISPEMVTPPALPPQPQTPPAQPAPPIPQLQQRPVAPQPLPPVPPNMMMPPAQPRQMMPQLQQRPVAPQPFPPVPPNMMMPPNQMFPQMPLAQQRPTQPPVRQQPCPPCGEAPRMMPMPYSIPMCPPLPERPVQPNRPFLMPSNEPSSSMYSSSRDSSHQEYAVPYRQSSSCSDMYASYEYVSPYHSYQAAPMYRPHGYMNSPMYPSSQHMAPMPGRDIMPDWEQGHDESSSSQ